MNKIQGKYNEITFSDSDVVNYEEFTPKEQYNPHKVRPFLFHDHGFCIAIVFASCLQDALDEAVDKGKMDRYAVSQEEMKEYGEEEEGISRLGNAGEPFDIESLGILEMPNPSASFVAQWNVFND